LQQNKIKFPHVKLGISKGKRKNAEIFPRMQGDQKQRAGTGLYELIRYGNLMVKQSNNYSAFTIHLTIS